MPEVEPLVSAATIAKMCGEGITSRTVLRWAKLKRIPCVRVNDRVIRFDMADVRKTLKARSK